MSKLKLSSIELCAGGGGQALGLEAVGFEHEALYEIDTDACNTLRYNRPNWNVKESDLFVEDSFSNFRGVDLVAGGLPCPPFSVAGKQLGERDERNLFSRGIEIVDLVRPKAVMFENVKGMLAKRFDEYRQRMSRDLVKMGYTSGWYPILASDFGVPQSRHRVVLVALKKEYESDFRWPPVHRPTKTVAETIGDLISENGWKGAQDWMKSANVIAPTIVGGSKKHGGPDLGPTRAKAAWREIGVNGSSIAEEAPLPDHNDLPRLTVRMVARIQGFPDDWQFVGKKTSAYRQVGNAFPPPAAAAVASCVAAAIGGEQTMVAAE